MRIPNKRVAKFRNHCVIKKREYETETMNYFGRKVSKLYEMRGGDEDGPEY